jgi:hypothetical protein
MPRSYSDCCSNSLAWIKVEACYFDFSARAEKSAWRAGNMSDVMKQEALNIYRYLGSVADSIKENNFFQAEEDMAALKKLLKGQSGAPAAEIQKRFPDIAKVVKQRRREPALDRVRFAMRSLESLLP